MDKKLREHLRKKSEKKIRKVEKRIRNLPVTPQVFSYMKMYQSLTELHFQGDYILVLNMCNAVLKNWSTTV